MPAARTPVTSATPATGAKARANVPTDILIYAWLALATLLTWRLSQAGLFQSGDDIGYWLGVAGGSMLLALFTYPIRKHVRVLQRLGRVKWWFMVHMALGVVGTLTILLHSNFNVRSTNAAVALYSMLIVSISGVIGRVLHVRVHRGLHGQRSTLAELKAALGFADTDARSVLHFAPSIEQRLQTFGALAESGRSGLHGALFQVLILPIRQWTTAAWCRHELNRLLRSRGEQRGWPRAQLKDRQRQANLLVARYLGGIVKVSQFAAYERLFSLWHVLHVPFVYLFVATAVFHVVAVHAY